MRQPLLLVLALAGALACDPVSRLRGTLRTPTQPVAGARVKLICPWGTFKPEMQVVGEPRPATSDDRGEFVISIASFEQIDEACVVRVERDGQPTFEAVLSTLPHQLGPEVRTVHARILLDR